ncbi:MAG TPA: HemK2/MTQ2 family protein methyltransferase [Thermoplasmata archaeon]|nr:HemK2/MTQ2 family protein methyltransferase [Thermoplasmata archaeon]
MDVDPTLIVDRAPGVYAPSEDSLLLLKAVEVRPGERMLELGTGSGLIALHAARIGDVVATDIHPEAVLLARRNAATNGLRLSVVRADLFHGLRSPFDVIVMNPPYLIERIGEDWEARAWQGGPSGDALILRFLDEAPAHLAPDGRIYVLIPSNRERAMAAIHDRFRVAVAGKRPLFYETLYALELSSPG